MKKIENRDTKILFELGNKETLRFADLMIVVMNKMDGAGKTPSQLRKDFRVIDVLEKASKDKLESFELEDADFDHFMTIYGNDFAWGFMHRDLIAFDDVIKAIKEGKEAPKEVVQSATE